MGVSKNNGTPKSSILIGFSMFSIINHPFLGTSTPIFGNTHMKVEISFPYVQEISNRTHVSRTPKKPEYLIALSPDLGVRW